jgi:thiol-disulfide isomerase/thioredoxin
MAALVSMAMSVVHAPELDRPGIAWLNTDQPLSLAQLRGRLVVLHFWTFGCVNCLHAQIGRAHV